MLPAILAQCASDEYLPPGYRECDHRALAELLECARGYAPRLGLSLPSYLADRRGTAAALRAVDAAAGGGFYDVPESAVRDADEANAALGGDELVIDVQTHYVARHRSETRGARAVLEFIKSVAPDRYRDLGGASGLGFSEFLRCVYLESDTAVAVLTAAPGEARHNILPNHEIAATRELLDRLAGNGRLLHHAIVHPDAPGEIDALEDVVAQYRPAGLKVYTLYGASAPEGAEAGWMLDDEEVGTPFLERTRSLGVRIVCAHKGLGALAPTSSPRDIGPAASAFPELDFLVYHSGYEVPEGDVEEGSYSEEVAHLGTNRLIDGLRKAGIGQGENVYAELGSTWYLLMRRPREAAHVLGKLLLAVGEDNLLWGTDSVWYGPARPLIDAFRAFQIPAEFSERYGYPPLTRERKAKILGLNAARVYGVDPESARAMAASDDLAWTRTALEGDE